MDCRKRFSDFLKEVLTIEDSEMHVDMEKLSKLCNNPSVRAAYFRMAPSADLVVANLKGTNNKFVDDVKSKDLQ